MYKCKLCKLLITFEDVIDPEFCCGRCTMDDWDEVKTIHKNEDDLLSD